MAGQWVETAGEHFAASVSDFLQATSVLASGALLVVTVGCRCVLVSAVTAVAVVVAVAATPRRLLQCFDGNHTLSGGRPDLTQRVRQLVAQQKRALQSVAWRRRGSEPPLCSEESDLHGLGSLPDRVRYGLGFCPWDVFRGTAGREATRFFGAARMALCVSKY